MINKLLALTIVAQLLATGAFAQSGSGTDTGTQSGATDPEDKTSAGDGEALMGSAWSDSLGAAVFSDTTRKTVRTPDELKTQWTTLSAEDRDMLRRDCSAYSADTANGTTGAATGGTSDTGDTEGTTADAATAPGVSREQMKEICATVGSLE